MFYYIILVKGEINMKKTITCQANNIDLERIEDLKKFYAECWNVNEETISTSDIIKWSIGMLHQCKVEQNFMWMSEEDFKYGIFRKQLYTTYICTKV